MGDRISPPETGYAPQPSRGSPDRDPDGRIVRRPSSKRKAKKKGKKKDRKNAPRPSEDKDEDGKVDIRAIQIAMHPARSSAPPAPGPS